jgi:hypothetical protein
MYTIDESLNDTLINYLWTLFNVLSTIVVISGVTPFFAICLIPIVLFYLNEQSYFTVGPVGLVPGSDTTLHLPRLITCFS